MHEMSITLETVKLVVEQAEKQGFKKVTAVWLEIGELSCIEADAIQFCFDIATRETLAEGAKLHIIIVPGEAWCFKCDKTVLLPKRGEACPHCGGYQLNVMQGNELRVKEIEVG